MIMSKFKMNIIFTLKNQKLPQVFFDVMLINCCKLNLSIKISENFLKNTFQTAITNL